MYFRDKLKLKNSIVAVFLFLSGISVLLAYKYYWVSPADPKMSLKNRAVLSDEEYKKVKQELVEILNKQDPKIALNELRERVKKNDPLLRSCHLLTHDLGHAAYQKYGSFGEAMKFQDEICNSGYMHGVIESYFSQNTPDAGILNSVCGAYPEGKFMAWECYHGVGHGLMLFTQNDLPQSLELCSAYPTDFTKKSCENGVFMENFNTDEKLHPSKFLKQSDPFYPCNEESDSHKASCYLYAPAYYLNLHKNDYSGAIRWCNGAEWLYGGICVEGVGTQAMKENINDVAFVEKICMSTPALKRASCFKGMTGLFIKHFGSLEPARNMCGELKAENRQFCYNTVTSEASLFSL